MDDASIPSPTFERVPPIGRAFDAESGATRDLVKPQACSALGSHLAEG